MEVGLKTKLVFPGFTKILPRALFFSVFAKGNILIAC